MRLTDLFIRRPVLATVINLFILIAGWQSIRALTVRQYPRTESAVVTVSVLYPGANDNASDARNVSPPERVRTERTASPFQAGDWVRVGSHEGRVDEITWRAVRLSTWYGDLLTVPNNEVARHSRVPVLNMQCDIYHPFQCLADLFERRQFADAAQAQIVEKLFGRRE